MSTLRVNTINDLSGSGSSITSSNLKTNTIQNSSGTTALNIDSIGRVTMPNNPLFHAADGPAQTGVEQVVQFTTVYANNGSCYNTANYRFTAPATGYYFFAFGAMAGGATYNRFGLYKNGALYDGQKFAANQTYERFSASWVVSLIANDYVTIVSGITGASEISIHVNYREFCGFLLS